MQGTLAWNRFVIGCSLQYGYKTVERKVGVFTSASQEFRTWIFFFISYRAKAARTGIYASKVNHCQQKHKHFKCSLLVLASQKSTIGSDYISVVFVICLFQSSARGTWRRARIFVQPPADIDLGAFPVIKYRSGVCVLMWRFRRNQSVSFLVPLVAPDNLKWITASVRGFVMD